MTFSEFDKAYQRAKKAPFWDAATKKLFFVFAVATLPFILLILPFLL